jgi:hypothetical protein
MAPKSRMQSKGQMNGLYPIIRRVRRPLLPVEVTPDGKRAGAKPVPTEGQQAQAPDGGAINEERNDGTQHIEGSE